MPQILDHFLEPVYGQVILADQDAGLSWQDAMTGQPVSADRTSITVFVAGDDAQGPVEVEVYLGTDEAPALRDLEPVYTGQIYLTRPGLLVFEPTGDEVLLQEVPAGPHDVTIYRNGYPTTHLVVIIDGYIQPPSAASVEPLR
jgi:hypothetical protein